MEYMRNKVSFKEIGNKRDTYKETVKISVTYKEGKVLEHSKDIQGDAKGRTQQWNTKCAHKMYCIDYEDIIII